MGWFKKDSPPAGLMYFGSEQFPSLIASLPVGVGEFHEWSERIIAQAGLSSTVESQKYTLATMLTQLPPDKAAESDEFFVKAIRRAAANQVAVYYKEKIYPEVKARLKAEEEKQAAAATAPLSVDGESVAPPEPVST